MWWPAQCVLVLSDLHRHSRPFAALFSFFPSFCSPRPDDQRAHKSADRLVRLQSRNTHGRTQTNSQQTHENEDLQRANKL